MKKNGYTLPELLVVLGIVSLIAIISIVKISFAYSDINNTDEIKKQEQTLIKKASLSYSNTILDRIKDEKVVYVTGKELMETGFLANDDSYNNLKVKLYYNEKKDEINYEVVS